MKTIVVLFSLLVASTAMASTKVLLLDDIQSAEAVFAWDKADGEVALSATSYRDDCMEEMQCFDSYSTGALVAFKREDRNVYYVGGSGESPVLCGRTRGFLSLPSFDDACRISVEPERVCLAWYDKEDCVLSTTKYRVYVTVND